jgi:hypothetical protein
VPGDVLSRRAVSIIDSEGLLILTNDRPLLTTASWIRGFAHDREYWVQVEGNYRVSRRDPGTGRRACTDRRRRQGLIRTKPCNAQVF